METSGSKGEVKTERCNEAEASAVIEAAGAAATDGTEFTAKVAGDAPIEATAAVASKFAGDAAIEAAEKAEIKVESGPVDHVERRVEETSVPAGEASEDVKMEDVNVAGHGSNDATDVSNLATEASQGATDGSNDANKDDGTGDVGAASDKDGDTAKDDAEARSANPAMDDDSAANCSSPRATSPRANDASAMSPPRDPAVAALGVETNGDTPPPSKPGAGTPSFSVGTPSVAADTPRQKNISPDSQSSLVDPGLVADENAAPFTISQWQQLEQQALISSTSSPAPPSLLNSSTRSIPPRTRLANHPTALAVTDQKYCERHMHRGRNRLGKSRRLSDKATAGSSLSIQAASSEGPMGCVEGTCSAMTDTCTDTPCHKGLVPKFELGSVSKMEIGSVSKLRLNTDDVGSTVTRGSPPPPLALPPPAQPVGADQARTPASKTSGLGCSKQLAIELSPENTGSPVPTNQQPHDPACTPSATAAPAASASAVTGSDTAAAPPSRAMFTPFGLPEPTPAPSTSSAPPPEAASNSKLLVSGGSDCYNPQQPQQQQQQQQQQQPFEQQQQQQPFEQQQHFGADPRLQKSQSMPCHSSGSSNGRIQLQLNGSLGPRLTSTFQPGHSIVEGDEGSPAPMPPQQPQQQHALMPSRSMPPRQQQSGASNALYSQQQQPAGRMGSPPRMQRSTSLVLGGGQRLCLQVPPSGNSRTPVSSSGMAPAGAAAGADTAGAGGGNGVGQLQPGHYQLQTGGRGPNGAPQQQQGMDQAGQPQPQQTPYTPQQGQSRQGAAQRGEACKFSSRALVLSGEPESPETHPLVSARSAYSDGAPKAQQPLQQQQMRVQPVQGQQQPMNVQHQAQPQPQHQPQPQVSVQQAPLQQASVMQPQPMQTTAMSGPPQPMRAPRGSMLPPPPPNVQPPLQQQQPHSQTLPMPLGGLASSSSTTSSTSSGGGVKVPLLRLPSLVQRPPAHPSPLGPPPSSLSSHGSGLSASSMASPIGTPVGTPMGAPHSNPYVLTRCSSVPEPRHGRPHLMRSQSMFESPRKSFIHPPSACADDRQQQQQPPQQQQSGLSIDMFFSDDSPWEEASALIGRSPNLGPLPCVEDADDCGLISGPPSQYFSVNPSDSQDAFLAA
ncbi:unnamed protein product [Closterium sp. NIES-65]|nr:unnamed protein product [Closterium sp. NIES-65]